MNKSAFVDSDVILDLLAKRAPFFSDAARLFTATENGALQLHTSPLVFANVHYILRKSLGGVQARNVLMKLRKLVAVLNISEHDIDCALASDFNDFEDAIQYYCSINSGISTLLTRNVKDYASASSIIVCTPAEFLASYA